MNKEFIKVMYDFGAYYGNHLKAIHMLESVKDGPVKIDDSIIESLYSNLREQLTNLMVQLFAKVLPDHSEDDLVKQAEWFLTEANDQTVVPDPINPEAVTVKSFQEGFNYGYENPEEDFYISDLELELEGFVTQNIN